MEFAIIGENGGMVILGPGVCVGYHRDMPEAVVVGSAAGGSAPLPIVRKCASHEEAQGLVEAIVSWWDTQQFGIARRAERLQSPEIVPTFDVRTWTPEEVGES